MIDNDPLRKRLVDLGLPLSPYANPPRELRDLPELPEALRTCPPEGLLAAAAGPQYPPEAMEDPDSWRETDRPLFPRVRAFPIPCLMQQTFEAANPLRSADGFLRLLRAQLPAAEWGVAADGWAFTLIGAIHKYGLFRTTLPAPPDLATGQPMGLDVAGRITHLNDSERHGWIGDELPERLRAILDTAEWHAYDEAMYALWLQSMRVQITQVTYANLLSPGINMPFYL